MGTVPEVVEAVGAALLSVVTGVRSRRPVRDVTLAEPDDLLVVQEGDLVLGVAVSTPEQAQGLLARCRDGAAVGLVLKPPLARDPGVTRAAEDGGVAVLELAAKGSWAQLVWLLRGVIDRSGGWPAAQPAGTGVYDDLFTLADAAASALDAPVTIEDAQSRVLAYSSRQDRADPARVSTIVGRRVPGDVLAHFRARGVFRRLARSGDPIFVPEGPGGILPRLVIPVRAGGELLGSVWAVVEGPVPAARVEQLLASTSPLAVHLLRLRVQADVARRLSTDRLRAALSTASDTGPGPVLPTGPWRVAALHAADGSADAQHQLALWESICRRHGWGQPLVADVAGGVFAVLTEAGEGPGSWRWLTGLVEALAVQEPSARVAGGGRARTPQQLPRSRAEAAELLALPDATGSVLRLEDSWAALVVHRAPASVPRDQLLVGGPLPALLDHDRRHGTDYVATLAAWLEQQGDPRRAAARLHVHPNTLRYRLRRLAEVVELDLGCPRARLALQIQLAATAPGL
jgi:hypothetical protein